MGAFDITLEWADGTRRALVYDPDTSTIEGVDLNFAAFDLQPEERTWGEAVPVAPENPGRKTRAARKIKISMGYSCNRACSYCSQGQGTERATGATISHLDDAQKFLRTLDTWWDSGDDGRGAGTRIEFWGGEPLLYWKKITFLAEAIRERWPKVSFGILTNGDLLTMQKIDWLDRMGFEVGVSHDGPGQHLRGSDPLDTPAVRDALRYLVERLGPKRCAFNAVLTARHYSLAAVESWIADKLGLETVPVCTEGMMWPYDVTGMMLSPKGEEHEVIYASLLGEMIDGSALRNHSIWRDVRAFAASLAQRRPATALDQICGMDRDDHIAVDLTGNVYTCQNAMTPDHRLGDVSAIDDIRLTTSRHHSLRPECRACPVLQLCQGACMFLEDEKFAQACDNSFTYFAALLAGALYHLTRGGVLREIKSRDDTPIRNRPADLGQAA